MHITISLVSFAAITLSLSSVCADETYSIHAHTDIIGQSAPEYRDVNYRVAAIRYIDAGATLIATSVPHNIVLLYIVDHAPVYGTHVVGGISISPEDSEGTNGYMFSRDQPDYLGLQPGETATNGLNGGSFWTGGIDLNGDGDVGTYTQHDDGTWTVAYDINEGMTFVGDPDAHPIEHLFRLNGIPEHPASGTGPVTIASIDIIAPWTLPPTCALLTASLDAGFPTLAITNFPTSSTVTVQRCEDLMATNWIAITNLSIGFTNWIDYTLTGDWERVFYKLAR